MTCEDAPCCGCCGTGVWGNNNPEPMDDYEWYGEDRYYDEDDYTDEELEEAEREALDLAEDAAMESALWGEC